MISDVKYLSQAVLDLLYPSVCAACQTTKVHDKPLCLTCQHTLPVIPAHIDTNPAESRLQHRFHYESAHAWLYMTKGGIVHNILHQIKYKYRKNLAQYLAENLAQWAAPILAEKIQHITAVPIHPKKEAKRGYNQTHIFAQAIAQKIQKPFHPELLQKVKNTSSQTTHSRISRLHNLSHSIQLQGGHDLANTHILLIDDVLTTGSTLETCTHILRQIPEAKIHLLTLAVADF